jgi:hypothetical protein
LADTAQICPTPSTWTFTLTFACPGSASSGAFQVAVPVTGGGGTEDITSQITAALPANPCAALGGPVSYPSAIQGAIPIVLQASPTVKLGNSGCTWSAGQIICTGIFSGTPSILSPMFGNSFRSGIYVPNSPSFTLGTASGVASVWASLTPQKGGQYIGSNENVWNNFYSSIQNRTRGSNQGFLAVGDCFGISDCIGAYNFERVYGGQFYGLAGASEPAAEFAESAIETGPYIFQATVTGSPAPGATAIPYTPTAAELANEASNPVAGNSAGARYLYRMNNPTITGTVNLVSGASANIVSGPLWSSSSTTQCDSTIGVGSTCNPIGQQIKFGTTRDMYAVSSDSVTFTGIPTASDTLTINGVVFTFVASGATAYQVNIGGSTTAMATNLLASILLQAVQTNTPNAALQIATYTVTGSTLNIAPINGFNETFPLVASNPTPLTLTGTNLGCDGDDVIINSVCTGSFYLVTGVGNTTLLYLDLVVDKIGLTHATPSTTYMMVQSAQVTDVDVVNKVFTIAANAGTLLPAWSNGDLLYQPADWRMAFAGTNMNQYKIFPQINSTRSWGFRAFSGSANNGGGQIRAGLEIDGARVGGGYYYGIHPEYANLFNVIDLSGPSAIGEKVRNSLFAGPLSVFGGHALDFNGVTAKSALNTFGATSFSVAAMSLGTDQGICWSLFSTLACESAFTSHLFATAPHISSYHRLGVPGTPTSALDIAQWKDSTLRFTANLDVQGGNEGSGLIFRNNTSDYFAAGMSIQGTARYCISASGLASIVQGDPCIGTALSIDRITGAATFTTSVTTPQYCIGASCITAWPGGGGVSGTTTPSWHIASVLSTLNTPYGAVTYSTNGGTIKALTVNVEGSATCVTFPTVAIYDCGTTVSGCSPGTSLTSLATTSASQFSATGLSVAITAGHFFAPELTANSCSVQPTLDVSATIVEN